MAGGEWHSHLLLAGYLAGRLPSEDHFYWAIYDLQSTRDFDCRPETLGSMGPIELEQWHQIKLIIENLVLSSSPDTLRWCLNSNKKYTTKSLYRAILFRGALDERLQFVWRCPCPMKLKHFIWLALRDKIQSCEQLKLKGWVGSENCLLCGNKETTDHIIFDCPMATFVWCICRDALGWDTCPGGFDDFFRFVGQVSKAGSELWRLYSPPFAGFFGTLGIIWFSGQRLFTHLCISPFKLFLILCSGRL